MLKLGYSSFHKLFSYALRITNAILLVYFFNFSSINLDCGVVWTSQALIYFCLKNWQRLRVCLSSVNNCGVILNDKAFYSTNHIDRIKGVAIAYIVALSLSSSSWAKWRSLILPCLTRQVFTDPEIPCLARSYYGYKRKLLSTVNLLASNFFCAWLAVCF